VPPGRHSHEQLGIWSELVEHVALHQVDADHFIIVHHPDIGRILAATLARLDFTLAFHHEPPNEL
jgi:hypothetical protein